jgi:hypothetical protein
MSETSNWQDRAECRGEDPAIFFPPTGEASIEATSIARAICGRCLYCTLMHAVENKEWLEEYEVLLELYRR